MTMLEKVIACSEMIETLQEAKGKSNKANIEVTEYLQSIFIEELKKLRDEFSLEILGLFSDLHDRARREEDDDA